ncbi:MAG: DUF3604 domain-containing protein [Myxococcota bacterium]|nr:DUF3604 domain-containing protein [Myxococcota bacterium]
MRPGPVLLLVLLGCLSLDATADTEYSPTLGEDFPMRLLWGDTHVHSSFSMDANSMGNTRLGPDAAYRFAKGEPVKSNTGMTAQLDLPLDFLVVSDHAEYMGLLPRLRAQDEALMADPVAKRLSDLVNGDAESVMGAMTELIGSLSANTPIIDNGDLKRSIWDEITRLADAHNEPGTFSALIGYEWTSMPGGDNLHRVVIYEGDAADAARLVPVSAFDGPDPEDLWSFMEKYEQESGSRILAIPHNPNVSNGRMFAIEDSKGRPFDPAYTQRRARHEPLVEVTQIKGDSETHGLLSPDDEFADFETWDFGNLNPVTTPKQDHQLKYEYARQALKHGLAEEARTGTNPFKFGMIGATDSHTSLATGAEANFWGKATLVEPGTDRTGTGGGFFATAEDEATGTLMPWQFVASGYAGVWAHENTRESLFAAMRRKEVYATSGPRMIVRFFGGFDYEADDALRPDATRIGYRGGVPMGGDLSGADADGRAPTFLISALKDPHGANLDRVQVVKGWRSSDGGLHEKVYEVALSDGRVVDANGKAPALVSTVDADDATFTNSVGAAALSAWWQDPGFDSGESAFYYARVIQIPTPRWPAYDAKRLGHALMEGTQVEVQDRAYTSPIWYTP